METQNKQQFGQFSTVPDWATKGEDFANYEKERAQSFAESNAALDPETPAPKLPNQVPDTPEVALGEKLQDQKQEQEQERTPEAETPETNVDPSDTETKEEGTQNAAEKDSGSGGTADKADKKSGDLPAWVKSRLGREKKIQLQQQQRIKELEAQVAQTGSSETASDAEPSSSLGPPDRTDYEDIESYLEDADAYAEGSKLPHDPTGKYAKASTAPASEPKAKAEEVEMTEEQKMMSIVQETVDADDVGDENLWDKFQDLVETKRIDLTEDMLTFLAHEDQAAKLVAEFVRRPVASRRIALLGDLETRVREMDSLLKAVLSPKGDAEPPNQETAKDTYDSRPPQGSNPTELDEAAESFQEFERRRKQEYVGDTWSF